MTTLRLVRSSDLSAGDWERLTELCIAAFDEPWDGYWESIGPGLHVIAEGSDGAVVAHAAIVDRLLYAGSRTLQCGYVEAVAVQPPHQRSGLGTQVMREINRFIDEGYELGALGTGSQPFYERLGWVVWQGPTWIRHRDGRRERSASEDGGIMVLITPRTPQDLGLADPIAVDWRPGDVW